MAKWFGKIGYGVSEQIRPGVYDERIIEQEYIGDFTSIGRRLASSGNANDDIVITNTISIIADPFAISHYSNMLYVELHGAKWKAQNIQVAQPRLNITLGGLYNG